MNKQRYLAELQRLLVFMTEEDRAAAVRRYADMFDEAGEEGEDVLIAKIGSPTKAAIALSRGYEPGSMAAKAPEAPAQPRRPKEYSMEDMSWEEIASYDLPDYMTEDGEDGEAGPEEGDAYFPRVYEPDGEAPAWDAAEAEPWRKNAPGKGAVERGMPLGLGIPLFVLIIAAIGIPLFAAIVAVMAALLCPGLAGLVGAYLAAVGGLWCVGYMADAIFMFGLAFIILALGLVLLWGGIWINAKIIDLYAKGVQWLCGELLGRRVTEDE